jgi:hypothetical protein
MATAPKYRALVETSPGTRLSQAEQ